MAPKGKGRNNEDLKQEDILQAVVIADSFNVRFGPVTINKPRALLPLVNVPLLDYTLEALASSGVQEVFVVCCHLGDQVRDHIKRSKWQDIGSTMTVSAVMSDSCRSMGDALREIDAKSLIRSDFILVSGDIVSNMNIGEVVKEHKARTSGKDKSSVMTMLFKVAKPGHRSRTKEDEMFLVEEGDTHRLLHFEKTQDLRKIQLPTEIMLEHDDIIIHNDLMDCHISVCSKIVPTLFTDNFDYLTRDDFVKGILMNEEIMGNKIHLSIIHNKYAARVSNLQTYDSISKDVINRWTYPLVPDMFGCAPDETVTYCRHNVYFSNNVTLARGCELLKDVVVGGGSFIGCGSKLTNCVVGKNCRIGENVNLKNCFLWDNATIEDNCDLDTAILCSGVHVSQNVVVKKGVILSWQVSVGPDVTIAQGTLLMSEPQKDDFDEHDLSFGDDEERRQQKVVTKQDDNDAVKYGAKSKAFLFKPNVDSDDEEEGVVQDFTWGLSSDSERNSLEQDSEESERNQGEESDDEGGLGSDFDDDSGFDQVVSGLGFNPRACMMERNSDFYRELLDTFIRAHREKIKDDNLILEINSLKHAFTVPIAEVYHSIPVAIFELGAVELKEKVSANPLLIAAFKRNVTKYAALISKYIKNSESQLDAINGLGDFVIRYAELRPRLPQMINFLYDIDVLTESAILSWYNSSHFVPGSHEALKHAFLRKLVKPFVIWLQEAEEESSDDDEEEDGE